MRVLAAMAATAALTLMAACGRPADIKAPTAPALQTPPSAAPATARARVWEVVTDEARVATGKLTLFETRYPPAARPDTGKAVGAAITTSVFVAEAGQVLTTVAVGAVDGAALVMNEQRAPAALAAVLSVPLDASLDLYRVLDEGADDTPKLCGKAATSFLVLWRLPGGSDMKLAPITGPAPGGKGATVCAVLDYRGVGAR